MIRSLTLLVGSALWGLPLVASLAAALVAGFSPPSWWAFLAHPQVPAGMLLALWTGTSALILAAVLAALIAMAVYGTRWWNGVPLLCAAALAMPHLAFAIGFGFLIMPSGILARLLVGGTVPPEWMTTHDPLGLSLIAVLVLKETPFLLLMLWSILAEANGAGLFAGQIRSARSLGHAPGSAWLRVVLPQLLRRMLWPLIVVWVYGATVVDVALVIGPAQPPTAGSIIWTDLNDSDAAINQRGISGALALSALIALVAGLAVVAFRMARPGLRRLLTRGPSPLGVPARTGMVLLLSIAAVYLGVLVGLALWSVTPRWPYPDLLPRIVSFASWQTLIQSSGALMQSLFLAATTSLAAVVMTVLWFETMPGRADRTVLVLGTLALGLPALAIAAGQYRLALMVDLTATELGLFIVHLTPVLAYAFIVLCGPYRAFDGRLAAVSRSLGIGPVRHWLSIKLPVLKAPVLAALAVGFSVSLVQFVPAQLVAAGRHTTLPIEAVTLASGGNRSLTAAYALALALPAMAVFALAGLLGRPRWR